MQFFLLTNYSNYTVSDETLALLDQLKKGNSKKLQKEQHLENRLQTIYSLRCYTFKFIHMVAVLASIKLLPVRKIAYNMCVLFYSSYLWHWWFQDPCNIYDGALCDKRQGLEAITIVTKSSILYVSESQIPPSKSLDKLRQTISPFSSV